VDLDGSHSYPEVKLCVGNFINSNYGLCLGAVSLFHSINTSYVDPDQVAATETKHLQAENGSQLEMKVAIFFQTTFPAVIFQDTTTASSSAVLGAPLKNGMLWTEFQEQSLSFRVGSTVWSILSHLRSKKTRMEKELTWLNIDLGSWLSLCTT
jgi:hypothetical protein